MMRWQDGQVSTVTPRWSTMKSWGGMFMLHPWQGPFGAQLGDLRFDLRHPLLGGLAVLLDRGPQRRDVVGAVGEQLLLGVDRLVELADLAFARRQPFTALLDLALGGHVLLRVLGLRELVLGAGDQHLVVGHQVLLLAVVTLGLDERRALGRQQPLDTRQVVLRRRELDRNRAERVFQFLNLCVVSLEIFEALKLVAQSHFLPGSDVSPYCREWAHLDSNQGPGGYEPPALTAELWAQPCTEVPCTKKFQSTLRFRHCRADRRADVEFDRRRRTAARTMPTASTAAPPPGRAALQPHPGSTGGVGPDVHTALDQTVAMTTKSQVAAQVCCAHGLIACTSS